MLDFYADWCVSCKEMEKYTFTDPAVQATLKNVVLLRANVTANDTDDQALMKRFGIIGPPTIAFYGADGHERAPYRVVGFMKAPEFADAQPQGHGQRLVTPVARAVLAFVLVAGAGPAGFLIYHTVFDSHPLPPRTSPRCDRRRTGSAPASTPGSAPARRRRPPRPPAPAPR